MLTKRQQLSIESQQRTPEERLRLERFISALRQAMAINGYSQRRLAAAMGVESGTFTKYFQGRVDPLRVGTGIQSALAAALGVSLDALLAFYRDGAYSAGVGLRDVEGWISEEAQQSDLPGLLHSLQLAGERWIGIDMPPPRFTWPMETVEALGLSESLRSRLGLTAEALERLACAGEFEEELVEGFALVSGIGRDRVEQAFRTRVPVRGEALVPAKLASA